MSERKSIKPSRSLASDAPVCICLWRLNPGTASERISGVWHEDEPVPSHAKSIPYVHVKIVEDLRSELAFAKHAADYWKKRADKAEGS